MGEHLTDPYITKESKAYRHKTQVSPEYLIFLIGGILILIRGSFSKIYFFDNCYKSTFF